MKSKNSPMERWVQLDGMLRAALPHFGSWYSDTDGFNELRLKSRPDGTILAIAKGYGSDGGPVVCFGSGYGVAAALLALDATMQGNNWREDKPWPGKAK